MKQTGLLSWHRSAVNCISHGKCEANFLLPPLEFHVTLDKLMIKNYKDILWWHSRTVTAAIHLYFCFIIDNKSVRTVEAPLWVSTEHKC